MRSESSGSDPEQYEQATVALIMAVTHMNLRYVGSRHIRGLASLLSSTPKVVEAAYLQALAEDASLPLIVVGCSDRY